MTQHETKRVQHENTTQGNTSTTRDNTSAKQHKINFYFFISSLHNWYIRLYSSVYIVKLRKLKISCEYFEISKNTYFEEHLRLATSEVTFGNDCSGLSFWMVAFKKPS